MAKAYTVKILTPKEWDSAVKRLGCPHIDESNLGISDPDSKVGYVKSTQSHRLNSYLLNHEFEHLTESEATDACECGYRHKKVFKEVIAPIGGAILGSILLPGIGTALGASAGGLTAGALGAAGAGLGAAGASSLTGHNTKENIRAGVGAGLGSAGGQLGGALGGAKGAAIGTGLGAATGSSLTGGSTQENLRSGITAGLSSFATKPLTNIAKGITQGAGDTFTTSGEGGTGRLTGDPSAAPKATSAPLSSFSLGEGGGGGKLGTGLRLDLPAAGGLTQSQIAAAQAGQPLPTAPSVNPSGIAAFSAGGPIQGVSNAVPFALNTSLDADGRKSSQGGGGGGPPSPDAQVQQQSILDRLKGAVDKIVGFGQGTGKGTDQGTQQGAELSLKDFAIPAGLIGAGQAFGKSPDVPDLRGASGVQDLIAASRGTGVSDLGRLARTRLTEQLDAPGFTGLPGEEASAIKNVFERKRKELSSYYKYFRPTANIAEDSQFRQAMSEIDQAEADALAGQTRTARTQFETQRRQDIQTALGVDDQTLNTLATLAQLDVDQIQLRTGVSAQEAQDIREAFGNLAVASVPGASVGGLTFRVG